MDEIKKYYPDLTTEQTNQFEQLEPLYKEWNSKINVISRKDIDNFYEHHVLHSLGISKAIKFLPGTHVMDLGTGGGFPGIPLAIMFPASNFLLVDSIGKKLKVVDAVVTDIGLKNVNTLHERAENVPQEFDFVVSRAVTRLDQAWGWAGSKLKADSFNELQNGLLYLKGGTINDELPKHVKVARWELNEWFSDPYFEEKAIVHISKQGAQ